MAREVALTVPPASAGQRLDAALAALVPGLSRAQAQALLAAGGVRVAPSAGGVSRAGKASLRLRGGERVELTIPDPRPAPSLAAQDLPLAVLYEDADLAVLDKAAGMVVHPARGSPDATLVNALLHRYRHGGGAALARLGLVHRLDKDTSGCLVVARTEPALRALQAAWKARAVEKVYLAVVHGAPAAEGRLDTPYGRHPRDRTRFTSRPPATASARRAITTWRVRERFEGAALLEVALHTGRTHQIRVHLAEAGSPLLADPVYGGTRREALLPPASPVRRAAEAVGRQALHAWRLAFPHPRTGERVSFEAPVPADLEGALRALRRT